MSDAEKSFPDNNLGLQRGSVICSKDKLVADQLGIKIGDPIPIGFDGCDVRCGPYTWSIQQLEQDILMGYWLIAGCIDLSDPEVSANFAELVERIK